MQPISKIIVSGDTILCEIKKPNNIPLDIEKNNDCKKKVAIVTLFHGSTNYGGVLQAYALRKVIADLGYECEQLRYANTQLSNLALSKRLKRFLYSGWLTTKNGKITLKLSFRIICYILSSPYIIIYNRLYRNKRIQLRKSNFDKFNRCYTPSSKIYTNDTISESINNYDIFVSGSDQVWNPNGSIKNYLLAFVPNHIPKIAYAASISINELPLDKITFMQPLVNRFQRISVREGRAKEQLKDITTKEVTWVLDPTMLLTSYEWNTVSSPETLDVPYLFAYMLGDNKQNRRCASSFAEKNNLKLVTFPFVAANDMQQTLFGDIHSYGGPDTFLSLIKTAEYVITDSFHGAVFSILYHKKFVVLKRTNDNNTSSMNIRLYSLFKQFHLEKQLVKPNCCDIADILNNIDYESIDKILNDWREFSLRWLTDALHSVE